MLGKNGFRRKKINFCPQTFFATKINPANYANMFLTLSLNLIQNTFGFSYFEVTRPESAKGEVKGAEGPPTRSQGP